MSKLRHLRTEDYLSVIQVVNAWWGGRPMASLLPRLFFEHFQPTSFVIEAEGEMWGFLVGFRSQTTPEQAYIHFVGINPAHRKAGLGRQLYEHFFATVHKLGCTEVRSITGPINRGSIAFHRQMGFEVLPGDAEDNGVAVTSDYAGPGEARVLFRRQL